MLAIGNIFDVIMDTFEFQITHILILVGGIIYDKNHILSKL